MILSFGDTSTVRYNATTDYIQALYNGSWQNVMMAGLQAIESDQLIPTMTADNAPSGLAFSTSLLGGYAYQAFDGSKTSFPIAGTAPFFIGYMFEKTACVKSLKTTIYYQSAVPSRIFYLQGSNDNSNWINITTFADAPGGYSTYQYIDTTVDVSNNDIFYKYYRIYCNDYLFATNQYGIHFSSVQFTGYKYI